MLVNDFSESHTGSEFLIIIHISDEIVTVSMTDNSSEVLILEVSRDTI